MAKSLAERMAAAAADAVALTDTYFNEALDYSEDSVATLERLVEDVKYSMPGGASAANVNLLGRVWGAYLGEVLRRQVGGEWVEWQDEYGKAVAVQGGGVKVFPVDKVGKRITSGAEHDLRDYYETFRDLMAKGR